MHRVEEVHATEVFGTLEILCQAIDGNGRGIRGQYGVFADHTLDFGQYGILDLGIFHHGLDDQIDFAEIAIG